LNKLLFSMTNTAYTANGALSNKSTGSKVLDYYSQVGAMRGKDTQSMFTAAFNENAELTLRALFYTRDVRQGLGEREIFRATLRRIQKELPKVFNALVALVPEYGRWDDIVEFVDSTEVVALVKAQLVQDLDSEHPSILGKWMPSENASSKETKALARKWIVALGLTAKEYRVMLTSLRHKIGVVETAMSSGNWSAIDYKRVPSKAMTNYRKAFSKQDAERFVQYLEDVKNGKSKINSATLYPYEIVTKLGCDSYYDNGRNVTDKVLEEQWKALPDYMVTEENTLVVADVSGSMSGKPMSVALSLALYSAERNKGAFKDHFMVFSQKSDIWKISGNTLYEKFRNIVRAADGYMGNTNLQSVFDMVLTHAVRHNVPESDMPTKIFIISDMQFDMAVERNNSTNYGAIAKRYARAGYKLPLIVFWNVNGSGKESPAMLNDYVFLVSGLTPVIFKYALQAKAISAYDQMVETLMSERYNAISAALKGIMK
jgi:hypothetical protein